jgi:hypothetical protein
MPIDVTKAAKWHKRAEEYRIRAATGVSDGLQLAYRLLAELADDIARRFEDAALTLSETPPPPTSDTRRKKTAAGQI